MANTSSTCQDMDLDHHMVLILAGSSALDSAAALIMAFREGWLSPYHAIIFNPEMMSADPEQLKDVSRTVFHAVVPLVPFRRVLGLLPA